MKKSTIFVHGALFFLLLGARWAHAEYMDMSDYNELDEEGEYSSSSAVVMDPESGKDTQEYLLTPDLTEQSNTYLPEDNDSDLIIKDDSIPVESYDRILGWRTAGRMKRRADGEGYEFEDYETEKTYYSDSAGGTDFAMYDPITGEEVGAGTRYSDDEENDAFSTLMDIQDTINKTTIGGVTKLYRNAPGYEDQ